MRDAWLYVNRILGARHMELWRSEAKIQRKFWTMEPAIIGTLRGLGGRGVGDYTSLNRPYYVLIIGIPLTPPPYPLRVPMMQASLRLGSLKQH